MSLDLGTFLGPSGTVKGYAKKVSDTEIQGYALMDKTFRRPKPIYVYYGNQPSIETAFVFNHISRPWLTQYWSRRVVDQAFRALSPDRGYNGDEDQGLMGALSVLSSGLSWNWVARFLTKSPSISIPIIIQEKRL